MALRGRAAQPVRPGYMMKDVLAGKIPLIAGGKEEPTTMACMTDLHSTYRELVNRENQTRPKHLQLRGMTTESFAKMFKFARLLGMLEFVRSEPMLFPPPGESLLMIVNRTGIEPSHRKVFRLSSNGEQEERAWGNLCKAWREDWLIPSGLPRVEVAPPPVAEEVEVAPPVPKPKVPKAPPTEILAVSFATRPSVRQFNIMLKHLRILVGMTIESEKLNKEIQRLEYKVGDWQVELEDMIDEEEKESVIEKYDAWNEEMTDLYEMLLDRDLGRAIGILEVLAGER